MIRATTLASFAFLGLGLTGCSGAAADAEAASSTSAALSDPRQWRSVLKCDGAHIDTTIPVDGANQLVIDDAGAATYLRDHLNGAMAHDPFSSDITIRSDFYGPVLRPAQPNEMVWALYGFSGSFAEPREDFFASADVTAGQEIRLDVQRVTWDQDVGGGLFRKVTDLKVRLVRNGWQEYHCDPGLSGDPPSCGTTGQGWKEWEIANWTFRGCFNQ